MRAERDTILRLWNDTAHDLAHLAHPLADADAAAPATLPELFAAQASRTPEAAAVMFEDRVLSYAALDAHANRLAHHLQSLGVGPECWSGCWSSARPKWWWGCWRVLKAGGAYLPLDPDYPPERLTDMVSDAGLRVVLMQGALAAALPLPEGVCGIAARRRSSARRALALRRRALRRWTICIPAIWPP